MKIHHGDEEFTSPIDSLSEQLDQLANCDEPLHVKNENVSQKNMHTSNPVSSALCVENTGEQLTRIAEMKKELNVFDNESGIVTSDIPSSVVNAT